VDYRAMGFVPGRRKRVSMLGALQKLSSWKDELEIFVESSSANGEEGQSHLEKCFVYIDEFLFEGQPRS
jgi:hypothetical protein